MQRGLDEQHEERRERGPCHRLLLESHFWIDLRKQIAAAVLMQVLPYCDESSEGASGFERRSIAFYTDALMADG